MTLLSRFPEMGTTIFTVKSKMAEEQGAINLAQDFPDFDGPAQLRERVAWHMANGHTRSAHYSFLFCQGR
jgi:methionine aminotransferase